MSGHKGGYHHPRCTTYCKGPCYRSERANSGRQLVEGEISEALTMTPPVENPGNPSSQPDEDTGVTIIRLNRNGERIEETLPKDPFKE